MNLQQLEYIVALDKLQNFVKASEACFVTQATLSMMVKKLEEELEVKLFDRSRQPVKTTAIGEKVVSQAKHILAGARRMKEIIEEEKGIISGELRIGIIPTLAPYLLPLFLKGFLRDFPQVKLLINEFTTEIIIQKLRNGDLDAAVLLRHFRKWDSRRMCCFMSVIFCTSGNRRKAFRNSLCYPKTSTSVACGCSKKGIACARRFSIFARSKNRSRWANSFFTMLEALKP